MKNLIAIGEQIVQARPAVTTFVNILQGAGNAGPRIEIYRIVVVETAGAGGFWSLCHDVDGTTFDESTALWWEQSQNGNTSFEWTAQYPGGGIPLGKNGAFGFLSSTANRFTITMYSATAPIDERRTMEVFNGGNL